MEEKYDPEKIQLFTYGRFFMLKEYKEYKAYEYEIFIEIKKSRGECYLIKAENEKLGLLLRGLCSGTKWRVIQDPFALSKDKDSLGKSYIRLSMKIIKEYPDYEEFWKDVGR